MELEEVGEGETMPDADAVTVSRGELGVVRSTLHKLKVYSRGLKCLNSTVPVWDRDDERCLEMVDEIFRRNIG